MAIIITAHYWRAQYEWFAHAPLAQKGGLADDIIEAIRVGKRPAKMAADEEALYNFCTELHEKRSASATRPTRKPSRCSAKRRSQRSSG